MSGNGTDLLEREELLALLEGADSLNQTIGLPEVLRHILRLAQDLTHAAGGSVILHDLRRDDLYFAAATGPVEMTLPTIRIPVGEGYAGKVFATGVPIRTNDIARDQVHYKAVDEQTSFETTSMLCVPLVHGSRRHGVMQLVNKSGGFTPKDEAILVRFGIQATIAISNQAVFERLLAASGLYASPEVRADIVDRMTGSGIPATKEFLTVLFVDLRGSTQLSQSIGSPEHLQRMMSELLGMLSIHVIQHRGIVNKFLGDGLMAVFRHDAAPRDALRAGFAMLAGFDELLTSWRTRTNVHLKKFLGLGIGVVSDEVILGTIGTEATSDFTVIGTPVNLAAALQEAARGETHVLCCSQTYLKAQDIVLEADGPLVFELRKPTQDHGIEYDTYHVKSLRAGSERPRVFVSYSTDDRALVHSRLVDPLKHRGVEVFSMAESIPTAADWERLIGEELDRCDWFVVVVSRAALESKYVHEELTYALNRQTLEGRIVPVTLGNLDAVRLHWRLKRLQRLALDGPDAEGELDALAGRMLGAGA